MRLSDAIEQYIKLMLQQAEYEIELKRNKLAEHFSCAPSQINYVLSTRFTPEHGYVIKSKRGGGGCIQIFRMSNDTFSQLNYLINEGVGCSINKNDSFNVITQLLDSEIINENESRIMKSALSDQAFDIEIPEEVKNILRSKILTQMILELSYKS